MLTSKTYLAQQLDNLNEEQLKQVGDFINFLKFQARSNKLTIDEMQMAKLYQEFTEEDRLLAEQGMEEYEEMLSVEDDE